MDSTTSTTSTNGDVMTLPEMAATARRDLSAIEEAQAAQTTAEVTYEQATQRALFLSDEAHQAARRDLFPPVAAARQQTLRVAEAGRRNALVTLHQTATARLVVTPDEQAAAARQEPVVRRVVDTQALTAVRDEMRGAIIAQDRAAMLLFATMVPDRLAKADPGEAQHPELGQARGDLGRMLSQVRDALRDTSFDPARRLATDVFGRAGDVSGAAFRRQADAQVAARIASGERVAWPKAS